MPTGEEDLPNGASTPDHVREPRYLRFDCTVDDPVALAAAAEAARRAVEQGECIVMPTDTVYGIGADAFDPDAVQRLLDAKRRGRDMPPPVLIAETSLIRALATEVPDAATELVDRHWPGPLTIIVRRQPSLRMDLGESAGTVALRVPDHELTRDILRGTGPMAVSSANLSGRPAAVTCDEAIAQLADDVAVYLDGGPVGGADSRPSTIVDFTQTPGGEVLRHGALSVAVLRETCPDLQDLVPAPDPREIVDGRDASDPELVEERVGSGPELVEGRVGSGPELVEGRVGSGPELVEGRTGEPPEEPPSALRQAQGTTGAASGAESDGEPPSALRQAQGTTGAASGTTGAASGTTGAAQGTGDD